jgi:uncharacterized membrane protein
MNTGKHLKIAGALQFVPGSMWLLFGSFAVVRIILDLLAGSQELSEMLDPLTLLISPIIILGGVVQIWFGISLIMQKQWTSQIAGFIICAIFGLVGIPVGTVVNGYTLWVLMQVKKEGGTQ